VTVEPLPPVAEHPAPVMATPVPVPAPAAAPIERPLWRKPALYAWIALLDTMAASAVTVLYLRKAERGRLRLAAALTLSSAVFVAAALAAWLL
jgi:hypothetical protein